eukprot:gnl/TRDRNA2_/TRDRNA2_178959_c0_seq1.p1 gnl/TRDRNA2_/TRDRNA2_178959_c0~~gnl/TRDRNA2_/TRDRNA2_178959_c0_seq1.p1  ORF type:complete len:434 (+),score=85.96 gnl/TRDRNA2_/TRDRNA2_178959_c0_seq1:86-1387(+)
MEAVHVHQFYEMCEVAPGVVRWFAVAPPNGMSCAPVTFLPSMPVSSADSVEQKWQAESVWEPAGKVWQTHQDQWQHAEHALQGRQGQPWGETEEYVELEAGAIVPPTGCSASRRRRRLRAAAAARAEAARLAALRPPEPSPQPAASDDNPLLQPESIAELTEQLEAGGEARSDALAALAGSIQSLAFDAAGCRLVQTALKEAGQQQACDFLAELAGQARACCSSPHANYVIQKAIEVLPTSLAATIAEELLGSGYEVARHRFGCRVLCRLVEHHCSDCMDGATARLIDEILQSAAELICHNYGHHVINAVLEHGSSAQRQKVAVVLRANAAHNAKNRHASFVCETLLTVCTASEKAALADELIFGPGGLVALAGHQFGIYVVRAVLKLPGDRSRVAQQQLLDAALQLRTSKYGRRVLEELRPTGTAMAPAVAA